MLTIAQRTRIARYKGDKEIPTLMNKRVDDIKVGDLFYIHDGGHGELPFMRLMPLRLVFRKCWCGMSGLHVDLVFTRLMGTGGKKKLYMARTDAMAALNNCCLEVPSEHLMVFIGLELPSELEVEVLSYTDFRMGNGFENDDTERTMRLWGFEYEKEERPGFTG